MFRKILSVAALAACAATPAFAADAGFESGNSWVTPIGGLSRVAYGSAGANVDVRDDAYNMQPSGYGGLVATVNVDALPTASLPGTVGVGSYFGLLETCAASVKALDCNPSGMAFSVNLGGAASVYGDLFLVRLMTADYEPDFNDKVTVTYYGASGVQGVDHVSVFSENLADPNWVETQGYHDSNWAAFAVPVGTNAIQIQLDNVAAAGQPAGYNLYNRPIVAIDYAAAVTPVPEAGTSAMMLAGLGVLGLVARRRKAK